MKRVRGLFLVAGLLTFGGAGLQGQQAAPAQPAVTLTPGEMEQFLLMGTIVRTRNPERGVTNSKRATLTFGNVTHDAQIQDVDEARMVFEAGAKSELNFKDTYRFNIGGYRLARLVGLTNVPMSVKRKVNGKDASMTWWVDDVQFDEGGRLEQKSILGPDPDRTSKQIHVMRVWDELIQNVDRNQGNMLWTKDWTLWMIDHTRGFRLGKELKKPDVLTRCDRALLDGMRKLTLESVTTAVGDIMRKDEIQAVLVRRDLIVKLFDARIASRGEAAVLFSM